MQSWLYLILAIVLEVAGTTSMKLSEGFRYWLPSVAVFGFYALSFSALIMALRTIPVSVAYAVWSGVGTALIAAIGMLYFQEPAGAQRLISIGLIVAGVIGLNASSPG